ncbi:MAG: ABC transporter permease, partial [Methanoregula sp.]
MSTYTDIATIARWEVKRSFSMMSRDVLPIAIILLILLVLATGFTAQTGLHIQDRMYTVGVDDPDVAQLLAGDARFAIYLLDPVTLRSNPQVFDLIIVGGRLSGSGTDRAKAAQKTLERDYAKYVNSIYNTEQDLFAAYPLWIDSQEIKAELDFLATQSGHYVGAASRSVAPVPDGDVKNIQTPSSTLSITEEELRQGLVQSNAQNTQISRYTEALSSTPTTAMGNFKTPSQISPPLPFDSIILVFVFIFPLYFTSQFFMMSIMNERIERKGEILLSTPVRSSSIILGKALPYLLGMFAICAALILYIRASPIILLPLIPVIFFFLANALLIGMLARSFKELSFLSIFFST